MILSKRIKKWHLAQGGLCLHGIDIFASFDDE
jgi:hypothetical protein